MTTSTPVNIYNPITVHTPLTQNNVQTVQQQGGQGGQGRSRSSEFRDEMLLAALSKPRVVVLPVFIGK